MFDGFDMAMLGDIHKRQTFGEGYEHISMSGSMIQQNHGELLENHGYLLWDIPTRTFRTPYPQRLWILNGLMLLMVKSHNGYMMRLVQSYQSIQDLD